MSKYEHAKPKVGKSPISQAVVTNPMDRGLLFDTSLAPVFNFDGVLF